MKESTKFNILSEHRINDSTYDFLESIKFKDYQVESPDDFELITYINNTPHLAKKIFESTYEVGFCETFKLTTSNDKTELHQSIIQINKARKSIREYSTKPITLTQLSDFLNLYYTITDSEELTLGNEKVIRKTRNIGSGGGIYSSETYVINTKIEGIPQGIFRYNYFNFELELINEFKKQEDSENFYDAIMKNNGRKGKGSIDYDNSSCFIILTSVLNKHTFKYKDFGVMLSILEVGSLIQSAYLAASTLNLATCPFGSIKNKKMHNLIELKNSLHQPLIALTLGNKI